jgi:histidine-containing phosphotransfer protein
MTTLVPNLAPTPVRTQRAALEQEAYDEKNKLLNQAQFQELLDLQTDEEPDFVHEARSIHWSPYDRVGVVNADP